MKRHKKLVCPIFVCKVIIFCTTMFKINNRNKEQEPNKVGTKSAVAMVAPAAMALMPLLYPIATFLSHYDPMARATYRSKLIGFLINTI